MAHAGSWLKMKKPAELPIRGRPGMNPSHHGSDEQMFGVAIGQLALEAGIRDMRIGEFVGELVTATIQKNLFQRVLDIS